MSNKTLTLLLTASTATLAVVLWRTRKSSGSNADAVEEAIKLRRSIFPKQFVKGGKVEDEVLMRCLQSGIWAPNHHITEPWTFVVYKGAEKIRLGKFLADQYKETAGVGKFNEGKYKKKINNAAVSSHIVAIVVKRNEKEPEMEELCSVAMAVQNVSLMASELGVGMYWSSGSVFKTGTKKDRAVTNPEAVRVELGLEGDDFFIGWLFVGDSGGQVRGKGRRKGLEEGGGVEWRG
jgi:hypothetical protein